MLYYTSILCACPCPWAKWVLVSDTSFPGQLVIQVRKTFFFFPTCSPQSAVPRQSRLWPNIFSSPWAQFLCSFFMIPQALGLINLSAELCLLLDSSACAWSPGVKARFCDSLVYLNVLHPLGLWVSLTETQVKLSFYYADISIENLGSVTYWYFSVCI